MKKEKMLIIREENLKKPYYEPLKSSLGVKCNVNIVNIRKTPPYFQYTRDFFYNLSVSGPPSC